MLALAALAVFSPLAFAQDECSSATPLALGANGPFTNVGSTVSAPPWSCAFVTGGDVWFSFANGLPGMLTIDTEGTVGLDTTLEVFDACGGSVVACDDDGGTGLLSSVTFTAAGGTTYFARVGGFSSGTGMFMLNVAANSVDECTGALPIFNGSNGLFDNTGATSSLPAFPCASANSDIWFAYSAPCDGTVTIDTFGGGSLADTVLEVFDACGGTSIACNDDSGSLRSSVTFATLAGVSYRARVGDFGNFVNQGTFPVNVAFVPTPGTFPDGCECAAPIASGANSVTNVGSTLSLPGWTCSLVVGGDTWYSYITAGTCVDVTIDTEGTVGLDTVLEVWDGCGGNVLACDDDGGTGLLSSITLTGLNPGTMLLVRFGGFNTAFGAATLNVTETPTVLTNDECTGAVAVSLGDNGPFSTACATVSPEAWTCAGGGGPDVWYAFTANCTSDHTFQLCDSDYDTAIQVFDGCGGNLLGCNDDASYGPCAFTLQSSLTVALTSGSTYYVRVGGFFGNTGTHTLNVTTGTNTGSAVVTTTSACATTATLAVTGSFNIGTTVNVAVSNAAGFPLTGLGVAPSLPIPLPCGCQVISDGAFGLGTFVFTSNLAIPLPCDPSFIGNQFEFQGLDFFPAAGGCTFAVPFGLTDIITLTIG